MRVTFSDVKQLTGAPNAPPYKVDLQTYANYYPFGMMQPMRSYPDPGAAAPGPGAGTTYRYGYNGKEMDNEWYGDAGNGLSGVGNSYDYGARMYNPRLGRFYSIDPLSDIYPSLNGYHYAANSPIYLIDRDGEKVDFASDNADPAKAEAQFWAAVDHLESRGAWEEAAIMRYVYNDPNNTARLRIITDDLNVNEYKTLLDGTALDLNSDSKNGLIIWNPRAATGYVVTHEQNRLGKSSHDIESTYESYSPAISLLHEFAHLYIDFYFGRKKEGQMLRTPSTSHRNKLEEYIIVNIETQAAKKVGEVQYGRPHHSATKGLVFSVSSTFDKPESAIPPPNLGRELAPGVYDSPYGPVNTNEIEISDDESNKPESSED